MTLLVLWLPTASGCGSREGSMVGPLPAQCPACWVTTGRLCPLVATAHAGRPLSSVPLGVADSIAWGSASSCVWFPS